MDKTIIDIPFNSPTTMEFHDDTPNGTYIDDEPLDIDEFENKIPCEWTDTVEQYIIVLNGKIKSHKWMHNQERIHYERALKIIKRLDVIFTTLMFLTFSSNFIVLMTETSNNIGYNLTLIVLSIQLIIYGLVTIIKAIRENADYNRSISEHKIASGSYAQLSLYIDRQLSFCQNNRIDAYKCTNYINTKYSNIVKNSPSIRECTMDLYMKSIEQSQSLSQSQSQNDLSPLSNNNVYNGSKYQMDRWFNYF